MRLARIFLLLLGGAAAIHGQTTGAGIQGTITDPTGVLQAKASLRLRNTKTGASWEVTTGATGRFQAPLLPPGEYEISISAEDFVRSGEAILERIQLSVGDEVRLNLAVSVEPNSHNGPVVARINRTRPVNPSSAI